MAFIAPAIDPLATNMELPIDLCRRVIADSGVDPARPLLLQVSAVRSLEGSARVVRAYRLVKEEIPEVQLVLIGAMAGDDPEGWEILDRVEEGAANDPDLFVFTNLAGVGSMEVKRRTCVPHGCDVVGFRNRWRGMISSDWWCRSRAVAWKEKPRRSSPEIPARDPRTACNSLSLSTEPRSSTVSRRAPSRRCAICCIILVRVREFGRAGREHVGAGIF